MNGGNRCSLVFWSKPFDKNAAILPEFLAGNQFFGSCADADVEVVRGRGKRKAKSGVANLCRGGNLECVRVILDVIRWRGEPFELRQADSLRTRRGFELLIPQVQQQAPKKSQTKNMDSDSHSAHLARSFGAGQCECHARMSRGRYGSSS